jgi:hypothetical protein
MRVHGWHHDRHRESTSQLALVAESVPVTAQRAGR